MQGNSRPVSSTQNGRHPRLETVVRRHLASPSRRPPAAHTRRAFDTVAALVADNPRPLILDSGCGTGAGTRALAHRFSDHWVVGVDRSAHRLRRARHSTPWPDNALLVRADFGDFWRLAVRAGWRPARHYLLYPNPWPKPGRLQRRFYASADFPALLALGGRLEVRSNWGILIKECAAALAVAGIPARVEPWHPEAPLTPFERKYQVSGHALFRCTAELPSRLAASGQ